MALITCPDCQKQVSDQAPACPNCGRPIAAAQPHDKKVQTIEATGKKYKGMQLIGSLLVCLGVISCVYEMNNPTPSSTLTVVLMVVGFLLMIAGRFGADYITMTPKNRQNY